MKTGNNISNRMIGFTEVRTPSLLRVLLLCGMLSSLLWMGADVLASMLYQGYSYTSQAISELSAIGAPTKALLSMTGMIYEVLLLAFGYGVLRLAGQKRALRITGILLITHAILALVSFFFPMNLREAEKTISDTIHVIIYSIIPLLILFIIWFGSTANGKWFRYFSFGTILVLILFGILTGMAAPRVAAGLPTPWLGIYERINAYGYMVWVIVFAVVLLRKE